GRRPVGARRHADHDVVDPGHVLAHDGPPQGADALRRRLTAAMRIGVDLGGTKIEAIALADDGAVRARRRVATPRDDYEATLAAIAALVAGGGREAGGPGGGGGGAARALPPPTPPRARRGPQG